VDFFFRESFGKTNQSFLQMAIQGQFEFDVYSPHETARGLVRVALDPGVAPPAHIVFCLDTSGSMHGVKLHNAMIAIEYCLQHLPENSSAGLVTFSSTASVIHPLTRDVGAVRQAMMSVQAAGATNLGDGLRLAYEVLHEHASLNSHLILITDGEATEGHVQWSTLGPFLAQQPRFQETSVHVLGVGRVNEMMLRLLAFPEGSPEGDLYVIHRVQQISEMVGQMIGTIQGTVAHHAELEWSLDDPDQALDYVEEQFPCQVQAPGLVVSQLGTLTYGRSITLLFAMPARARLSVRLGYRDLHGISRSFQTALTPSFSEEEKRDSTNRLEVEAWYMRLLSLRAMRSTNEEQLQHVIQLLEEFQTRQSHPVVESALNNARLVARLNQATGAESRSMYNDVLVAATLQRSSSVNRDALFMSPLERMHSESASQYSENQSVNENPTTMPAMPAIPAMPAMPAIPAIPLLRRADAPVDYAPLF
jgi:uncharacterized protein YegL